MPKPNHPRDRRAQPLPNWRHARTDTVHEHVDPRWLIQALGYSLLAALLLGYLSVCLLVYLGGWQRMIAPSRTVDKSPATDGIGFDAVRFDAGPTGVPRLLGWWVPVDSTSARTVLLLHDAHGSLSEVVPTIALLHQAGVNVFAIDYRGFGASDPQHPTQQHMQEDAAAALDYLVSTRHLPTTTIIPYGQGLASVLAATLAKSKPSLPAVVLEDPDPDAFERIATDGQARMLPMHLLSRDQFDLTQAVAGLDRPALLIADTPFGFESRRLLRNQSFFQQVTGPKMSVTFGKPHSEAVFLVTLHRFLDEYVPS